MSGSPHRWVVVGAGAAGCVVAARLARAGRAVHLVEAGPTATPAAAAAGAGAAAGASFLDAVDQPELTFPGPFRRGRGLGGSSIVNAMIATAGDLAQYEGWGWSDARAALGRVAVPRTPAAPDELGPVDRALLAAAPDAVVAELTRRDGRRVTAADAYLSPPPPGLRIVGGSPVTSVRFEGRRATGVELASGDVLAADAVVVTAGAIGSPELLRRSGLTSPDIGAGLRTHPAAAIGFAVRPDVAAGGRGLVIASLLRRGDIQILPLNHLGPGAPGRAGLLVVLMRPTGAGRVVVAAGDAEPEVRPALSAHDRLHLAAGVDMARTLLANPAFASVVTDVDGEIVDHTATVATAPAGVFHATSTCRMGTVVDADGAVVGYDALFVADASVFPDIPTTNTYLPTLMLAERLATRLLSR